MPVVLHLSGSVIANLVMANMFVNDNEMNCSDLASKFSNECPSFQCCIETLEFMSTESYLDLLVLMQMKAVHNGKQFEI